MDVFVLLNPWLLVTLGAQFIFLPPTIVLSSALPTCITSSHPLFPLLYTEQHSVQFPFILAKLCTDFFLILGTDLLFLRAFSLGNLSLYILFSDPLICKSVKNPLTHLATQDWLSFSQILKAEGQKIGLNVVDLAVGDHSHFPHWRCMNYISQWVSWWLILADEWASDSKLKLSCLGPTFKKALWIAISTGLLFAVAECWLRSVFKHWFFLVPVSGESKPCPAPKHFFWNS